MLDYLRKYIAARGCILLTYADIPKNYLSSNAGLFVHEIRHMDVICVRTQIFLIMILNIQNRFLEFLRMYAKIFHVSIKDLRICANNPVLEDFVIRNHY